MTNWAGIGIGAGAHRLWAHKSYEAGFLLRWFLMMGQLIAGQVNITILYPSQLCKQIVCQITNMSKYGI